MDFLLYAASFDASVATRSKISKQQVRRENKTNLVRLTIDERVEDAHSAIRNTGIGMDLLENWKWYVSNLI